MAFLPLIDERKGQIDRLGNERTSDELTRIIPISHVATRLVRKL
jgi:hypothetical protein